MHSRPNVSINLPESVSDILVRRKETLCFENLWTRNTDAATDASGDSGNNANDNDQLPVYHQVQVDNENDHQTSPAYLKTAGLKQASPLHANKLTE
jgi:hypothetical protein